MIQQPHRELQTKGQRNQLVLDLTRPAVQEFARRTMDDLLTRNPGISYVKWDCNRYLTQPGSTWLKPENQSQLGIEYNRALLDLMKDVATRHPQVEMMVCAGGGGRVDYGSLRYFHEFWPSDNTDPLRRVTMQWDYSTFFPAIAISGHVTRWGNRPLKFAFDVAMSARLGLDLDLSKLTPEELAFAKAAVAPTRTGSVRWSSSAIFTGWKTRTPARVPSSTTCRRTARGRSSSCCRPRTPGRLPRIPKDSTLPAVLPGDRTRLCRPAPRPPSLSTARPSAAPTLMRDGLTPACAKSCDSAVVELAAQ